MAEKLRPAYSAMPGFSETDPRWHDYMRSVTEWYESLGYPGFNPLLPRTRARLPSPRHLTKRSRSRSAGSGRKKRRSMSPETREYDARGREMARRSRSRDSASRRYLSTDKESRLLKQGSKSHSSKHDLRLDSRTSRSSRVEKSKGKAAQLMELSTKEKAVKKGVHSRTRDVGTHKLQKSVNVGLQPSESVQHPVPVETRTHKLQQLVDIGLKPSESVQHQALVETRTHKLQKSVDIGLKPSESVQPPAPVETHQLPHKANVEGKPSVEPRKLITIPIPSIPQQKKVVPVMDTSVEARKLITIPIPSIPQQKKVMSLLDLNLTSRPSRYQEPVREPSSHVRKVTAEPLYQKEATIAADQKPSTSTSQHISHSEVETDKTVLVARETEKAVVETTAQSPPSVEREKEKVDVPPAVVPTSPVAEPVDEKPTTEAEPETNDKTEMPPPVDDEGSETVSKPDSVPAEETPVQRVTSEKTEVSSVKNIAEVKPLLVANIPEKSKWERDGEISDSRDLPMYPPRDRDRPTAAKTSLPRYVCAHAAVSWWRSIVVRPPVLPACFPYPCARLTAGRVTTLWVKLRYQSANKADSACHPSGVG